MSTKRLSPTANLLRSSRLFSLPPPLPRPSHELTSTSNFASETATLPHPTHAAVATPQSSLSRGDWGLKRSLPLRSTTNTSTPSIRIGAVDTLEHITDFQSAADHTLTARKWQEMNIPMSVPQPRRVRISAEARSDEPSQSVFEREFDDTTIENNKVAQARQRWKFRGPWLAGKTEGEFREYVEKEIRLRKPDFHRYLRRHAAARKSSEQRLLATDTGKSFDSTSAATEVSDDEFRAFLKFLRHDNAALTTFIHDFLDLPAAPQPSKDYSPYSGGSRSAFNSTSHYAETGPPKTHPSAGLSYLRTASYIQNHPILGPQRNKAPVQARILQPRRSALGHNNIAKLGIGGVVGEDSQSASFRSDRTPGLTSLDATVPGGAKIWVHPDRASIDPQGRIKLVTSRAEPSTVAIHEGMESETKAVHISQVPNTRMPDLSDRERPQSKRLDYGIGISRDSHVERFLTESGNRRHTMSDHDINSTYQKLQDVVSSQR